MRNLAFAALLLPTAATAEPRRIELGIAIGGHAFSTNTELGVADHMSEPGATSAGLLGVRAAVPIMRRLAAEAEVVAIPTEDDVLGDEATVYGIRAHARFDLLTGKLEPFVVAGLGAHVVRSDSPQMDNDTDRAYHWGGGIRYAISDKLDARVDARHLIVPDRTTDGATSDYEVTAGITYRFGAPAPVIIRTPPPPPQVRVVEKVVNLDKDGDGIVDTADSCPDHPELKNGWKDEDGCPDQVIQELAGIGFEHDSARIDSASAPILERAFLILEDNPNISIEISGHTSAEGNPDRNLSLSLKRAEAVKTYLVRRGIADTRIHTIGHGADVPLADNATEDGRSKNRRIEFRILLPGDAP
jgi:outer membrane protein OmpA-like peptidoglycan-associated protein